MQLSNNLFLDENIARNLKKFPGLFSEFYPELMSRVSDVIIGKEELTKVPINYVQPMLILSMLALLYKTKFSEYNQWRHDPDVKLMISSIANEGEMFNRISPSMPHSNWGLLLQNKRAVTQYEVFGISNRILYQYLASNNEDWHRAMINVLLFGDFTIIPTDKELLIYYLNLLCVNRTKLCSSKAELEITNDVLNYQRFIQNVTYVCCHQTQLKTPAWLVYTANTLAFSYFMLSIISVARTCHQPEITDLCLDTLQSFERYFHQLNKAS